NTALTTTQPAGLELLPHCRHIFTNDVLPPLYFVIWIVGFFMNCLAASIFVRLPTDSGLVVYLKNMVVADLLMLSTFPFKMAAQLGLGGWRLHVVICRYTSVLFYSSMYVGILLMGFISLERYVRMFGHSVGFARSLAFLTWSLLLLGVLPNVLLTSQPANETNSRKCMELKTPLGIQWHQASTLFCTSLFWVTLLVLAFCYTSIACRVYQSYRRVRCNNINSKVCHKVHRSIFSLLLVFFICFVPYHVCRVPYTMSQMPKSGFSYHSRFLLFQLKEGMLFLSAINVCLDPIIYVLMCQTFRESLIRKLRIYLGEETRSGDKTDTQTDSRTGER
uniref:Purinergic receptor P2Y14 n=1 Tax=Labrus bergylta TaxID=56723 RepID=A0A3Q3GXG7_9LABR